MITISSLVSKRNKIVSDCTAMVTNGSYKGASKEEYTRALKEADDLQEHISMLEQIERHQSSITPTAPTPATPAAPVAPFVVRSDDKQKAERKQQINASFRHFLKNGYRAGAIEQRDLTTVNGSAVIPQEFDAAYVSALKYYGPIATLVKQKYENTGRSMKIVVSNDAASTMTYLTESASTSTVETDPTFQSTIATTDALVTTVKFSNQLCEDVNAFENFIKEIAGLRVARAVEYALTLGKDNGTQTQLLYSPTGGLLGNIVQGAVTSTLSSGVSYANLVALAGSVDHAYWVQGTYMASPNVFGYLLSQTDSQGRPLYPIDPVTGLMQIAGRPLYVNNAMPAITTPSAPVVLFGDFSRAYAYLNGGGVQVQILKERYADQNMSAALIYTRIGAANLLSGAVKSLVTAAS